MRDPIIYKINDNMKALDEFNTKILTTKSKKEQDIILNYPTVYIHNWKANNKYDFYVGESNDIIQRTKQHFQEESNTQKWEHRITPDATLYIIGHRYFNKSMTLDIENKLMQFMIGVKNVGTKYNGRTNPQNKYFPSIGKDMMFHKIWGQLHLLNKELFPPESEVRDSAVFKASPLHTLTAEQEEAKNKIIEKLFKVLDGGLEKQLVFVEGEAGSGKTVLNSSTFYEIFLRATELDRPIKCCLMVNHDEQVTVYEEIARKLGLTETFGEVVCKPTHFINSTSQKNPIDIAFVDEAHLLLTQGKQSYRGDNQLADIIKRAKVTVVMFDENQILTTEQYLENEQIEDLRDTAKKQGNYIVLKNQMRMVADEKTIAWIDSFTKNLKLEKIPKDAKHYEIKIFDNPAKLEQAIKTKAKVPETMLSRLVATYDWEYSSSNRPSGTVKQWGVTIGNWFEPWNYELERDMDYKDKKKIKTLAWAEQPQTIDEVGSTFTIQGFDLSYVGVILGPSVTYRDGKIVVDAAKSHSTKAIRNRTLSDGSSKSFGETLLQHEVRVLMTRGVNGLYIYACDGELRKALLKMAKD